MMSRTNYEAVSDYVGHWLHRAQVSLLTGATGDGSRVVAGRCSVYRQVCYLSVGRQSEGQLPCGDVRAVSSGMLPVTGPSNMFTYVFADALVQWLFRKARPAPRCNVTQFDLIPGRQSHRRAGLKAGQQRAGAGNCAPGHGGGPGHHGRLGGRKQRATGLSNKADQSAFDVLEGVVATKSTPDGVKLSNYSTSAAMNGSIAAANNATLATVAANYGGGPALPRHSGEDHAAGGSVTAAALQGLR